jgi:hypothetical protein
MMTAIVMAECTGAAFAAELGSMKANQETDALKTMGISPMDPPNIAIMWPGCRVGPGLRAWFVLFRWAKGANEPVDRSKIVPGHRTEIVPGHRGVACSGSRHVHPLILGHLLQAKPDIWPVDRPQRSCATQGVTLKPLALRHFSSRERIAGSMTIVASGDL